MLTVLKSNKTKNKSTDQVIDDMRAGRVPSGIAEPLTTRGHVATHDTCRVRHATVPTRVFSEIPFAVLVALIVPSLLKVQPSHPSR